MTVHILRKPLVSSLFILIAALLWSGPLLAQLPSVTDLEPDDQKELSADLASARSAYEAGDFETALAAFESAYELYPHPDVVYRLALCHERLGHWEKAVERYEEFLALAPDAPERGKVEGLVETLSARIPASVQIVVDPPDARVEVDARPVPTEAGRATLELAPGEHVFTVTANDVTSRQQVVVEASETRTLELSVQTEPTAKSRTRLGPAFWGFTVAAVALGGGAAVTGLLAAPLRNELQETREQRDTQQRPADFDARVQRHNRLVIASWTMGGLAVASLASAFLFGRRNERQISVYLAPHPHRVTFGLTF